MAGLRSISSLSTVPAGEDLYDVPILALGPTVRKRLSQYLNVDHEHASDWKNLAEMLDYDTLCIQNWERLPDPTKEMLKDWGCNRNSTVRKLLECIQLIEREDITDDLGGLIERDVNSWARRRKEREEEERRNVQDPRVSSANHEMSWLVVDDDEEDKTQFDAYVCYSLEDQPFVEEMIRILEGQEKLKLYIPQRDLLPGGSHTTVTAELIENRCRRMIVVLSPQFQEDDFNNFCVKFGISIEPGGQSKRVIPVITSLCKVPSILQHLTAVDYTKKDLRPWFWKRLTSAIKLKL